MQQTELINTFFAQDPLIVLEIGPGHGDHTNTIVDLGHFVTAVEPREEAEVYGRNSINSTVELIRKDIFKFLPSTRKWDVSVALGVLWRVHSPYYLLDLMMNQSDHIVIDNPTIRFGAHYDLKYSISKVSLRVPPSNIHQYLTMSGWTQRWDKTANSQIDNKDLWTAYYHKNGTTPLLSALDNSSV